MITITPRQETPTQTEPLAADTAGAARLLGVCPRTITNLAKRGEIIRRKTGWRSVYPLESLRKYLESRTDNE